MQNIAVRLANSIFVLIVTEGVIMTTIVHTVSSVLSLIIYNILADLCCFEDGVRRGACFYNPKREQICPDKLPDENSTITTR
jgi:hypothetical protein